MKIDALNESTKEELLKRLQKRSPSGYAEYEERVAAIISDVRQRGDEALFEYTQKFDHVSLDETTLEVNREEIEEAYRNTDPALLDVIKKVPEWNDAWWLLRYQMMTMLEAFKRLL